MSSRIYFWITGIFVFVLDRLTKVWVLNNLVGKEIKLTSFLNLVFVGNKGIVFGIGNNYRSSGTFIFASVVAIIVVFLLFRKLKSADKYVYISLGMILGGGFGNLVDRVIYGYVVDFIDFHIGNYHWPAFNVADTFIVLGVLLFLSRWKGG